MGLFLFEPLRFWFITSYIDFWYKGFSEFSCGWLSALDELTARFLLATLSLTWLLCLSSGVNLPREATLSMPVTPSFVELLWEYSLIRLAYWRPFWIFPSCICCKIWEPFGPFTLKLLEPASLPLKTIFLPFLLNEVVLFWESYWVLISYF